MAKKNKKHIKINVKVKTPYFFIFILLLILIIIVYLSYPLKHEETDSCNNPEIKGNIGTTGEKIYHMPNQQHYNITKIDTKTGEKMFCTEDDAKAAGWRRSTK